MTGHFMPQLKCMLTEQKEWFLCEIYISRRGMILEWTTCSQPCSQSCACAYIQIAIATYTMNLSIYTLAISKSCNCLMWSWNAFNKILI